MLKALLTFSIIIVIIENFELIVTFSPTYDPCGYVGSSTSKSIVDDCLVADIDCCYVRYTWEKQDYYSCFNKNKMFYFTEHHNISSGFIFYLHSDLLTDIDANVYSKCNNTDGRYVTSPEPRGFYIFRRLSAQESEYNQSIMSYFYLNFTESFDDLLNLIYKSYNYIIDLFYNINNHEKEQTKIILSKPNNNVNFYYNNNTSYDFNNNFTDNKQEKRIYSFSYKHPTKKVNKANKA